MKGSLWNESVSTSVSESVFESKPLNVSCLNSGDLDSDNLGKITVAEIHIGVFTINDILTNCTQEYYIIF